MSKRSILYGLTAALMLMTTGVAVVRAADRAAPDLLVRTTGGPVLGAQAGGIENFLGISYAAPPVGDLRWRAPHPVAPWTGIRSAAAYGSYCPQPRGLRSPTIVVDEDCLFVNVQRPAGTVAGARLPVFVYIHGGGFTSGSSARDGQDLLVRRDGIIGVTLNYRLGALGFLALPEMQGEDRAAGDAGLLDQQLALRWVHDNIAAFGGDPGRVTIGGESAGGYSVCAHLVAPGSRGLFQQAIIESGSCFTRSLVRSTTDGEAYARTLGCDERDAMLACLRRKPVVELLDHQAAAYVPTRDNDVLPRDPRVAVVQGDFAQVPVLIGSTLDEQRSFTMKDVGWTRAKYAAAVRYRFGRDAATVLAAYPLPANSSPEAPAYQFAAATTDAGILGADNVEWGIGGCGAAWLRDTLASHVPVHAYEFAYRDGPGWYPIPHYVWGAGHATELVYLYPGHDGGIDYAHFTPAEHTLSDQLVRYWGAFVTNGRPDVDGQVAWPAFNASHRLLSLTIGQPASETAATFRTAHNCDLWDRMAGDRVQPGG